MSNEEKFCTFQTIPSASMKYLCKCLSWVHFCFFWLSVALSYAGAMKNLNFYNSADQLNHSIKLQNSRPVEIQVYIIRCARYILLKFELFKNLELPLSNILENSNYGFEPHPRNFFFHTSDLKWAFSVPNN